MSKPAAITYVRGDAGDWEAVYVNGVLNQQGHSTHWPHLIEVLLEDGYTIVSIDYSRRAEDEWLDGVSGFPDNLDEVEFVR